MLPLVLLVAVYGLLVAFDGYYVDVGWTVAAAWQRMVDWSAAPGWAAQGLVAGMALLSLLAFGLAVRAALRRGDDAAVEDAPVASREPTPASV